MQFLIVEDDFNINEILSEIVKDLAKNYPNSQIKSCYTGSEAQAFINKEPVDIVILDLMLPMLSGMDLLPELVAKQIPVLVITAKSDVNTLVEVLEKGASDYIAKPFKREEVIARLQKMIKQTKPELAPTLQFENLQLNSYSHEVFVNDTPLKLTQLEYRLLEYFLQEPKKVLTKAQIYQAVWGDNFIGADAITVHLSHLRSKLKQAGFEDAFKAIWGGWLAS